MSITSPSWAFLDNNLTQNNSFYYFKKTNISPNNDGYFAIISEKLSLDTTPRSAIGAKLLVEASRLALIELEKNNLNSAPHFFKLLYPQWRAKVLLDAIQNPLNSEDSISLEQVTKDKQLSHSILKRYDASANIIYIHNNQLMIFQSGEAQLALSNQRYNCEIKRSTQQSLSSMLKNAESNEPSSYQLIDIDKYQLEILALLPNKYTKGRTAARLKSNFAKTYRSFKNNKSNDTNNFHEEAIILKKATQEKSSVIKKPSKTIESPKHKKKRLLVPFISSALIISGISIGSYYLWKIKAKENMMPPPDNKLSLITPATSLVPEKSSQLKQKDLALKEEQAKIKKQNEEKKAEKIKLKKEQDKKEKLAKERQEKEAIAKKEAETARLLEEKNKAQAKAEILKQQIIEAKKQKELKQQQLVKAEKIKKELARKQAEKEKKKLQAEENLLASIEKDIETISQYEKKILEQEKLKEQQAKEKKRQEYQARLEAKKLADKKKKEALIKQRRLEFEQAKKIKNKPTSSTQATVSNKPKNREELQISIQEQIKKKEEEKKRIVATELKKQQESQQKAREIREKNIQKTITHQLVAYSKTFHGHVLQLKEKNQALQKLDEPNNSLNEAVLARDRERLINKKKEINQRLDRLATLYSKKLKKLCSNKIIHPVAIPPKSTKVERIALTVLSQKLRACSQTKKLSGKSVSKALINSYIK